MKDKNPPECKPSGADVEWIDREECSRCGGTGQVTEMVAGRSGMVACDACDNIPKAAVPEDAPADPEARYRELQDEIEQLQEEKTRVEERRQEMVDALQTLKDFAGWGRVDDQQQTVLNHIIQQWEREMHEFQFERRIHYRKDALGREKAELRTLLEQVDGLEVPGDDK